MKTRELLSTARALIADPRAWVRDVYARDATGAPTDPVGVQACAWCAYGALLKVASDHAISVHDILPAVEALACAASAFSQTRPGTPCAIVSFPSPLVPRGIFEFNDEQADHAAVMQWFARAIENLGVRATLPAAATHACQH